MFAVGLLIVPLPGSLGWRVANVVEQGFITLEKQGWEMVPAAGIVEGLLLHGRPAAKGFPTLSYFISKGNPIGIRIIISTLQMDKLRLKETKETL